MSYFGELYHSQEYRGILIIDEWIQMIYLLLTNGLNFFFLCRRLPNMTILWTYTENKKMSNVPQNKNEIAWQCDIVLSTNPFSGVQSYIDYWWIG